MQQKQAHKYDVVIIGSGPNGLCAGAYLARAGLKVLILEKRCEAGGGLATEEVTIPPDFDYSELSGLKIEEIEKLNRTRPASLGQASRIPGVRPAAIQIIMIALRDRSDTITKNK